MKKLVLLLAITLSVAACGSDGNTGNPPADISPGGPMPHDTIETNTIRDTLTLPR